jgi:hypothetical protein
VSPGRRTYAGSETRRPTAGDVVHQIIDARVVPFGYSCWDDRSNEDGRRGTTLQKMERVGRDAGIGQVNVDQQRSIEMKEAG